MNKIYDLPKIRQLLTEGFTAEELRRLCLDEQCFRAVYNDLTRGTGKLAIVDLILEHAYQKELLGQLLLLLQKTNPIKYEKYEPYWESPSIVNDLFPQSDDTGSHTWEKNSSEPRDTSSYDAYFNENELDNFVNREQELKLLANSVLSLAQKPTIINLIGPGGIGKSSLLKKFQQSCYDSKQPIALVEMDVELSIPKIIEHITNQLALFLDVEDLREAINKYKSIQVLMMYSRDHQSPEESPRSFNINNLVLRQSVLKEEELRFFQWADKGGLTNLLVESLNKFAKEHPIIVVFDGTERVPGFTSWLRRSLIENKLSTKVLIVISSRDALGIEWGKWRAITETIELGPLTYKDGQVLLQKKGLQDTKLIDRIIARSHGLPWVLAMLAESRQSRLSGIIEEGSPSLDDYSLFIELIFDHIFDERTKQLASCASTLRYFDQSILSYIFDEHISSNDFKQLCRYSFIRARSDYKKVVHQNFQDFFSDELQKRHPDKFAAYHQRAAEYFKLLLNQNRGDWQENSIEIITHSLLSDEMEGVKLLRELFSKTEHLQGDFARQLVNEISKLNLKQQISQGWTICIQTFLALYYNPEIQNWEGWIELLSEIVNDKWIINIEAEWLIAFAGTILGSVYYRIGKINNSINCYENSLELYEKLGDVVSMAFCLQWLGRNWRLVDPDKALVSLEKSAELYRKEEDKESEIATLIQLVVLYRNQGDWKETNRISERCMALAKQVKNPYQISRAYRNRGNYLYFVGDWEQALLLYDQAIVLAKEAKTDHVVAVTCLDKGNLLRSERRYDEANTFYQIAIGIYTQQNYKLGLNWTLSEYALSTAYISKTYKKSIEIANNAVAALCEIDPNSAYVANALIRLGQIYQLSKIPQLAIDYYKRAMELSEANKFHYYQAYAHYHYVATSLKMNEKTHISPEELNLAIDFARNRGYIDLLSSWEFTLGETLLKKGSNEEATEHFLTSLALAKQYNRVYLDCQTALLRNTIADWPTQSRKKFLSRLKLTNESNS